MRRIAVARGVHLELLDWGGPTQGGDGQALLFLAGLGQSAHIFDDFAPRFRDRFHVYAITRRGTYPSSIPDSGYDAATRARDIVSVLDSLHIERAVLVGHSIAGDELSKLGTTHPSRVRALVYLDAYDYGPARNVAQRAIPAPPGLAPAVVPGDSASPSAVAAFYSRMMGGTYPVGEVHEHFVFDRRGHLSADRPDSPAWTKVREGTEPVDFRRINVPALGIFATYPHGAADMFPAVDLSRRDSATRAAAAHFADNLSAWTTVGRDRFRADLARSTVIELPGAGHMLFLSRPDRVEHEMRAFFARTF